MADDDSFRDAALAGPRSFRVIASHRVRAMRGPMTGSAKQSSFGAKGKGWIASSQGLLAMTDKAELVEQKR